jgi:hypothetical protein
MAAPVWASDSHRWIYYRFESEIWTKKFREYDLIEFGPTILNFD